MTGDTNKRLVRVLDENSKLYRLTTPDGQEYSVIEINGLELLSAPTERENKMINFYFENCRR